MRNPVTEVSSQIDSICPGELARSMVLVQELLDEVVANHRQKVSVADRAVFCLRDKYFLLLILVSFLFVVLISSILLILFLFFCISFRVVCFHLVFSCGRFVYFFFLYIFTFFVSF